MFTGYRAAAFAGLVALALAVAGCGGSSGSDTPSAGDNATAQKLIDVAATPRDQVKDGGTMRWPLDQFSTQWNYLHVDGQTQATYDVVYATLPIPFVADEHAIVTANPDYVASFDVSTSAPQVVTLKLNPKARWSDGRAITWQDYATQAKALSGKNSAYKIGTSTGYERISSVKPGADRFEVAITFARPFGEWQSLFAPLYPKRAYDTPKHFNASYVDRIPVTAGPFKVDKFDKSAQSLRIVRDPAWWGARAKLDAIAYTSPELDAQVNAFANGEVDRVNIGADASLVKRASNTKGGGVRVAGGPDFRQFTLNGTSTLLKDVQVRRALSLSINRAVIAKSDLTGLNWPAITMDNHFFVNTQEGYVDNSGDFGTFDPANAKTLLDAAGWKQSGAFRKKAGKTLKLSFVIPSGVPASRQEAELAQTMAKDVGIQIDIKTVPVDPFFEDYIIPGNFDMTVFSFIGNAFPISPSKSIYVKPKKDANGALQVQQNFARIGSPAIDKLLSSAEEQVDVEKGRELVNRADKLIWDEVHSLILFQRPQNVAVGDTFVNVGAFGFKTPVYQDMGVRK